MSAARLTGLSSMLPPLVKNDGLIALLCLGVTVLPKVVRERNGKAAAWMMTPGVGVLLGWHMLIKLSDVKGGDLLPFTLANLLAHLNRAGNLFRLTAQESATWSHWGILWPASLVAGAFLVRRKRLAIPLCILFQYVGFCRGTRKGCSSTAVCPQCARCYFVGVCSMWDPFGLRNGRDGHD